MAYLPGQYSKAVALEKYTKETLKKENEKNIAREEKPFASSLHMAGREAYYKEYFEEIKLEDQILPKIGNFEDIKTTHHFNEGYKRAKFLVEKGVIPEQYQEEPKKRR